LFCDVTAARVTNVHVTDIGADYVSVTWDALVSPSGYHATMYEARCVDADRLMLTDDNHTEATSSSSSSPLSVLTSRTNATFNKLAVSVKYVIKVRWICGVVAFCLLFRVCDLTCGFQ